MKVEEEERWGSKEEREGERFANEGATLALSERAGNESLPLLADRIEDLTRFDWLNLKSKGNCPLFAGLTFPFCPETAASL